MYGVCTCISYTLVNLLLSVLNMNSELIRGDLWITNVQLFSVCFVISVLMLITDTVRDPDTATGEPTVGYIGIGLLDVAVPVLGLGGFVYKWFNVFSLEVLYPICILVIVYFVVFGVFYINGRQTEKELNRRISERKEVLNNAKQDN